MEVLKWSQDIFHNYSTVVTTILSVALVVLYRIVRSSEPKKVYPPGPPGLPIVGNLLSIVFSKLQQHELIYEWSKRYGKVVWFKVFGSGVVIINDRELMNETFQTNDVCDRLPMIPYEDVIGKKNQGLAFANGKNWKEHRKFFVSIFRKVNIGVCRLEDIVGEQVDKIVEEVRKMKGDNFDPSIMINLSIANIILRIISGHTYEWDDKDFLEVVNASGRLFDISGPAALFVVNPTFSSLPLPVNKEIRGCVNTVVGYITKIVEEHKKTFDANEIPKDFISAYLQEMNRIKDRPTSFDDKNLQVAAVDTLVAGWETVASTLRWAFHILATHPEAQTKMRQEIHKVVGKDRYPNVADRASLPYTEATIAECMRFTSAVPIHLPHSTSCDTKIGGYDIPKGSSVAGNLLWFAMDPTVWKDPETFQPERFIDASGKFQRQLEPLPFGFGKRACPGEQLARIEMFIYMAYMVQNFDLRLPPGTSTKLSGNLGITFRPHVYELQGFEVTGGNNNKV